MEHIIKHGSAITNAAPPRSNPSKKPRSRDSSGAQWTPHQKELTIEVGNGETAVVNVRFESPHYISGEFVNVFAGARFDYFSDDGSLITGSSSELLSKIIISNYRLFNYLNSFEADKLFRKRICLIKNKNLGEKKHCVDCLRKFLSNSTMQLPYHDSAKYIGMTSGNSLSKMVSRCISQRDTYGNIENKKQ